ncbi:hypothetical protein H8959_016931 [Pygathrix nigripes]
MGPGKDDRRDLAAILILHNALVMEHFHTSPSGCSRQQGWGTCPQPGQSFAQMGSVRWFLGYTLVSPANSPHAFALFNMPLHPCWVLGDPVSSQQLLLPGTPHTGKPSV